MRRDLPDFFLIPEGQEAIHGRLENWARYVCSNGAAWMAPMWKQGRANGRQWQMPVIQSPVNTLDGHVLEQAVRGLPVKHRYAIRWAYVFKTTPLRARKEIAVTEDTLLRLVIDGRSMLKNSVTQCR